MENNKDKIAKTNFLNQTKKWGIEFKILMEEINMDMTLRGYIADIKFPPELDGMHIAEIKCTWCDKGDIQEVLHIEEPYYTYYLPIFDYKASNDEMEKLILQHSKGLLEYVNIISFDSDRDRIPWALNISPDSFNDEPKRINEILKEHDTPDKEIPE